MNTMDDEMVNSLISVASRHNHILIIEDRDTLKMQREELLRRQNLLKKAVRKGREISH